MRAPQLVLLSVVALSFWTACGDGSPPAPALRDAVDPTTLHFFLGEQRARKVFDIDWSVHEYDPYTYFRRRSGAQVRYVWPEHPAGEFHIRTNSLGTRDDAEPSEERPDLRVLVTGDSHTDGVCANDESYANRLEARLSAAHPGARVEVWNAGQGGFSFYNYLGVLHKFLPLAPDVFVVGLYGGNDFLETLRPLHGLERTPIPIGGADYWDPVHAAIEELGQEARMAINQDFNQRYYFQHFPGEIVPVLEAALARMQDIADFCAERDVKLVVLYIPPPYDVQPERFDGLFARLGERLALNEAGWNMTDELASRFLTRLESREIEVVDGREALGAAARDTMLYWRREHHIALAAHELLARALLPVVQRELPAN